MHRLHARDFLNALKSNSLHIYNPPNRKPSWKKNYERLCYQISPIDVRIDRVFLNIVRLISSWRELQSIATVPVFSFSTNAGDILSKLIRNTSVHDSRTFAGVGTSAISEIKEIYCKEYLVSTCTYFLKLETIQE